MHPGWPAGVVPYALITSSILMLGVSNVCSIDLRSDASVRRWMVTGIAGFAGALAAAAAALRLGQLWLFIAALGVAGQMTLGNVYITNLAHVMAHFGPGPAGSFCGGLTGLSATLWSTALGALLSVAPPDAALLCIAAGALVFVPLCSWVSVELPGGGAVAAAGGPSMTRAEVYRSRQYWCVALCVCGGLIPAWGAISVLAVMVRDVGGLPYHRVAQVCAAVNALYTLGRAGGGFACARCGARRFYVAVLCLEAAACGLMPLVAPRSFGGFVALLGLAFAAAGAVKVAVPTLLLTAAAGGGTPAASSSRHSPFSPFSPFDLGGPEVVMILPKRPAGEAREPIPRADTEPMVS